MFLAALGCKQGRLKVSRAEACWSHPLWQTSLAVPTVPLRLCSPLDQAESLEFSLCRQAWPGALTVSPFFNAVNLRWEEAQLERLAQDSFIELSVG